MSVLGLVFLLVSPFLYWDCSVFLSPGGPRYKMAVLVFLYQLLGPLGSAALVAIPGLAILGIGLWIGVTARK